MVDLGPLSRDCCPRCGASECAHRGAERAAQGEMLARNLAERADACAQAVEQNLGVAVVGGTRDEMRLALRQLRDLTHPGQVVALPETMTFERLPDGSARPGSFRPADGGADNGQLGYRPADGSARWSAERSAAADEHLKRDIERIAAGWRAEARDLATQVQYVTGCPPIHLTVPDRDEPYALDHLQRVWRLNDDYQAYNDTDETVYPLVARMQRAAIDREADAVEAERRAARQREREATIRENLSDAHARATGAPLPDRTRPAEPEPAEPEPVDPLPALADTLRAARDQQARSMASYESEVAALRQHVRSRALSARFAAASAVLSVLAVCSALLLGDGAAVLLAAAVTGALFGVLVVRTVHHALITRSAPQRIDGWAASFSRAYDAVQLAEAEYAIAGGDPWGAELPAPAPEPATAPRRRRRLPRL